MLLLNPLPPDLRAFTQPSTATEVPPGVALADAGYGDETAFRDGLTELGLLYAVGVRLATSVWAPGTAPLPPKPWSGKGRPPTLLRRGPGHEPVSVKALAIDLPQAAYQNIRWREGSSATLQSRFAAYGFLMVQRLRIDSASDGKKTSSRGRHLPCPRLTSLAAGQRAQRHVPDSITTLRILLGHHLLRRLTLVTEFYYQRE